MRWQTGLAQKANMWHFGHSCAVSTFWYFIKQKSLPLGPTSPYTKVLHGYLDAHCFFKWASPGLFSLYFRLFKPTLQFLQQIHVNKYPSSIWCWDSNPRLSGHESPLITTRAGLPPITHIVCLFHNLNISYTRTWRAGTWPSRWWPTLNATTATSPGSSSSKSVRLTRVATSSTSKTFTATIATPSRFSSKVK